MRRPPRFWSRETGRMQGPDGELLVTLWGWSQDSVAEAAAMARDRLSRMAHLGGRLPPNEYYPRTPLREEVLHELTSTDGTLLAVVTRNRYGAQVLNTDAVVFVDVDVAEQRRGFWARLRREPAPTSAADAAVARISAFATNHPEWGVHAYRTAAGFRVLVTGSGAGPQDQLSTVIMGELESDPVYASLCSAHDSYRARLTPKPWRVGGRSLDMQYPETATSPRAASWVADYTRRCQGWATCQRILAQGPPPSADELAVISIHDHATLANSGLPLA